MSQSYKKECMYCKQEILMSETLGKWFPLNLDNSPHACREKKESNRAGTSKPSVKTGSFKKELSLEDLDLRLRMVETIVLKGANKK